MAFGKMTRLLEPEISLSMTKNLNQIWKLYLRPMASLVYYSMFMTMEEDQMSLLASHLLGQYSVSNRAGWGAHLSSTCGLRASIISIIREHIGKANS